MTEAGMPAPTQHERQHEQQPRSPYRVGDRVRVRGLLDGLTSATILIVQGIDEEHQDGSPCWRYEAALHVGALGGRLLAATIYSCMIVPEEEAAE